MIQLEVEAAEDLASLTLAQLLERDDLCAEELLAVKDIHNKIKRQMKIFVNYCLRRESFTDRLISLGLKCPMHESNNLQMKNLTFVCSDILTSDHQALADLLVQRVDREDNENEDLEIAEEIETEDVTEETALTSDKYKYLNKVLDYINRSNNHSLDDDLDENCINYIVKCVQCLTSKKLNDFLEYFELNPEIFVRLAKLSHYPSVGHLLTKLLTDEEDNLSEAALTAKSKIIPLLLQKIHSEISKSTTGQVMQCVEQILNSSRYGDSQQRSGLQNLSDIMVMNDQMAFFIKKIKEAVETVSLQSLLCISNCVSYLTLVLNRILMDEQQDYTQQPKEFRPTLTYEVDRVFLTFCQFIFYLDQLIGFRKIDEQIQKLVVVKYLQMLSVMAKHSRFGDFYMKVDKEERLKSLRLLIQSVIKRKITGIALQIASSLVEKMILQEQFIISSQELNRISPNELYRLIEDHKLHLEELVHNLAHQSIFQRNKNEDGIFLRKLLVILDNYFKNAEINKHFPEIEAITVLFPTYSLKQCKDYANKATVLNHPCGAKAKEPQEFAFIRRNRDILMDVIVDQLQQQGTTEQINSGLVQQKLERVKDEIVFKLQGKIKLLKERVREKAEKSQKSEADLNVSCEKQLEQPIQIQTNKQNSPAKESKDLSPVHSPLSSTNNCLGLSLLFFIRHLAIY